MEREYLSAIELAEYIKRRYRENYGKEISSLKLQKSLYFSFAYWAGFVAKDSNNPEVRELEEDLCPILFNDRIEAWSYGPVVPEVFRYQKQCEDGRISENEILNNLNRADNVMNQNVTLHESINDILDDIFAISDFGLVSMSHNDSSWLNNYRENDIQHNRVISQEEIINEYSQKAFN